MRYLAGPRAYYSLFGKRGLLLGAKARILRRQVEVTVRHSSVLHPLHLRLRTTDVGSCREIVINNQYDCNLTHSPRVIVDAGANIGLASIFYANRYPAARIIALEPEASNYRMLRKNVAPYPAVSALQAALWKSNGQVDLIDPGEGHTTFQTREGSDQGTKQSMRVPALTVDQVMDNFGIDWIDLLKVDIEGAEKEVFEYSGAWISRVGVIAAELHDSIRPGTSTTARAATQQFELSWQRGETTYWARRGMASPSLGQPSRSMGPKAQLKILAVDAQMTYRTSER